MSRGQRSESRSRHLKVFHAIIRRFQRFSRRRRPLSVAPDIRGEQFIFICGLHRSGTSQLCRLLQESPEIAGLVRTGAPEEEGQHLQSVFPPACKHGGPGRFAFDPRSRMDERSVKDVYLEKQTLLREWGAYFDLTRPNFIEKSPPNIIRTRYLQHLFPNARFIFLVRHPIAVSLATEKWSKTTRFELFMHWHVAHTIALEDMFYINNKLVVRYEDLSFYFVKTLEKIRDFTGIKNFTAETRFIDHNYQYFSDWECDKRLDATLLSDIVRHSVSTIVRFGYKFNFPYYSNASLNSDILIE